MNKDVCFACSKPLKVDNAPLLNGQAPNAARVILDKTEAHPMSADNKNSVDEKNESLSLLERLSKLKEAGVLTEEEFNKKKEELLKHI